MTVEISLASSEARFRCASGQNVLQSMMNRGRQGIPVGCRSGGCGVCKVRVLEGRYSTGMMSQACFTEAERRSGVVLACKLFPETNLVLEVTGKINKVISARGSSSGGFYRYTRAAMTGSDSQD